MAHYVSLIDGKAGGYGIVFPDLPGCTTMGHTIEEAMCNASEAMRIWLADAVEDGERVPAARGPDAIRRDPEVLVALAEGATLALVPLILEDNRVAAKAMG